MPRFYSHDFPRYVEAPAPRFRFWRRSREPNELPGVVVSGDTLGQFLENLFADTGVRVVPHDPPKYFRYFSAGSADFVLVDVHIRRGDVELCPKQDLAFALLPGDLVEAGVLLC